MQTYDADGTSQTPPIDSLSNCGEGKYKDGIYLDQSLAADHDVATKKLQELEANGQRAKGTGSITGFIAHEYAHLIINDLRVNFPDIFTDAIGPVLNRYISKGQDWIELNISQLASGKPGSDVKPDELLAEAFAESQLNNSPREAAKELGTAINIAYRRAHPSPAPKTATYAVSQTSLDLIEAVKSGKYTVVSTAEQAFVRKGKLYIIDFNDRPTTTARGYKRTMHVYNLLINIKVNIEGNHLLIVAYDNNNRPSTTICLVGDAQTALALKTEIEKDQDYTHSQQYWTTERNS